MTPGFLSLAVKWMELPFPEIGRTVGGTVWEGGLEV